MKNNVVMILYIIIIVLSSCTQPTINLPDPTVEHVAIDVVEIVPYEYTIIGTWSREFDGHYEEYIFTDLYLLTFCDGVQNGDYSITYTKDWSFVLADNVFYYELLHGDEDYLILNGYQYKQQEI